LISSDKTCAYPNGKLLIKLSKKNVKTFLGGIRKTIKATLGMSAADLIHKLNSKIRGWANYHRHVVSAHTFAGVDHHIFSGLLRWARRRHPNKTTRWLDEQHLGLVAVSLRVQQTAADSHPDP
jgi:RNA-directed DNA polymerase